MARLLRTIRRQTAGPLRRLTPSEHRRVHGFLTRLPYYRPSVEIIAAAGPRARNWHAASFLPHRHMVLDPALLARRRELARILYHEIFHFVWARLGNPVRHGFEEVLRREWEEHARGELGWSAESCKLGLSRRDLARRSRRWRHYVCESFCDSAAWLCLTGRPDHPEWSLKPRFRSRRRQWFLTADVLPRLRL